MSDNRKYYYLKLKENYFDEDAIVLLESMQDGILYALLVSAYPSALLLVSCPPFCQHEQPNRHAGAQQQYTRHFFLQYLPEADCQKPQRKYH